MTVIERIAEWCADVTSFSPMAIRRAEHAFTDTIGCMLAGMHDPATRAAALAFHPQAEGGHSAVVTGGRTSLSAAALINGVAAHALDFDDNFHGATTHASAVLVPALLATAQAYGCDGKQMVEAYIVGLEAQAWIARGVNPSHYTAGWHATSTVGCIGTAAGIARLMGQDRNGIAHAMSIGVSMSAGTKGQFGTPVKPLHSGLAARNAAEAALLSAAGMRGRLDILEARQGFLSLYGGEYPRGWSDDAGAPDDGGLAIETIGLTTKRHPCCGATHRAIDAVLDLRQSNGFGADDVRSVHVKVTQAHALNLAYPRPVNEMQARFSMPYAVALALLQDALTLSDFTQASVERAHVRALLPLTELSIYEQTMERAAIGRLPHHIVIELKDGRRLEDVRHSARGEVNQPFTEEEIITKFLDCANFSNVNKLNTDNFLEKSQNFLNNSKKDIDSIEIT